MASTIPSAHGHVASRPTPLGGARPNDTIAVAVAQGDATGSPWLELSVMACAPGRSAERPASERETILYVVRGDGTLVAGGAEHRIERGTGALVPAGTRWAVEHTGPEALELVAVAVRPDRGAAATEVVCVRQSDQEARAATGDRSFRVVVDPDAGCRAVTQFVGFIPPGRAPEHFHEYDEVIYVLAGRGVLHMDGGSTPFGPGATVHLPPRLVHCLENAGDDDLVVLGSFTPAGSPSDAFYPDGTRAYQDPQDPEPTPGGQAR